MGVELTEFQKEALKEFVKCMKKEQIDQINEALKYINQILVESGIYEFHKVRLKNMFTEELSNFLFKYEVDKFISTLPIEDKISFDQYGLNFPCSKEVVENHMAYFTKRLLHLYNFENENPSRIVGDVLEKLKDAPEDFKESFQIFTILNLVLYDLGVYDLINYQIERHISPDKESTISFTKFKVLLRICDATVKTLAMMAEEASQNNEDLKTATPLQILCHNVKCVDYMVETLKDQNVIKEMVVSLNQAGN